MRNDLLTRQLDIGRRQTIEPEIRPEHGERNQQEGTCLPQPVTSEHVSLRRGAERKHPEARHDDNQNPVQNPDINQQDIGVENEHEWQDRRANIIAESLNARANGITTRNRRSSKGGKADRRRIISKDAKIEDKEMHRHQRHDQSALCTDHDNHRGHQGGHHNVICCCWESHAEDQTHERHQKQHDQEVAAGNSLDKCADELMGTGQGHCADNDAGRGCRNTDADHVAGAIFQPAKQVMPARLPTVPGDRPAPKICLQRMLCDQDEHHRQTGPVG